MRKLLILISLISCAPSEIPPQVEAKYKWVKIDKYTYILDDPDFGVRCYWHFYTGISESLSCVKVK